MRKIKQVDETKESRNKLFNTIVIELLDGNTATNGYLGKKLKDIGIDYDVLQITLDANMNYLKKKMSTMSHPIGKINYMFTVLKDQIYK